jgi:uncharacterized damage-inducible protein DinB
MTETKELAEKLRKEGERLSEFFGTLPANQWTAEVYTENAVWTIRSVLSHLMTTERAFVKVFENILQGGEGVSEDFVIDRYNARQQEKTKDLDPKELLEQYRGFRSDMIGLVTRINDSDLEKAGRHPYLGKTTMREMNKMVYIHNQIHYRDIKKVLSQSRPD